MKAELENLKADNARRNFGKQGNSLFGEVRSIFHLVFWFLIILSPLKLLPLYFVTNCFQVEDKRLELEKKYGSLRARHEGMVKVHNMTKQQLQRLKVIKHFHVNVCES